MSGMRSIIGSTQHPSMSSCFSSPILPPHQHPAAPHPAHSPATSFFSPATEDDARRQYSLLFINDAKPPTPPPPLISTPLSSPRLGERKPGSGGINHCYRKREGNLSFCLTLPSSEEESLSPPGRIGSQSVRTRRPLHTAH